MTKPQNIESIEKATGRIWEEWVSWLDKAGARDLDHTTIARMIFDSFGDEMKASPGWWAQGVTVAYEQHIGRRVPGQRSDGTFEISVSRTVDGLREEVFGRIVKWPDEESEFAETKISKARTSVTPVRSYYRCDLSDGTKLTWSLENKGDGKCLVVVTQANLLNSAAAEEWRGYWGEYLDRMLVSG